MEDSTSKIKRDTKNSRTTKQMKEGTSSLHLNDIPIIPQHTKQSTLRSKELNGKNSTITEFS
jgi:hypothetical protein